MGEKGKSKVIIDDCKVFINLDDDDVNDNDVDLLTSFKSSFNIESAPVITIDDDDDNISCSKSSRRRKPLDENNPNPGALAQLFLCDLCTNSKPKYQSIKIRGCTHFFCCECVENYVSTKLNDGTTEISCPFPDCYGTLDPEYCKDFLSVMIYRRWGQELCESAIVAEQKFYCPFKDCSILLLNDGGQYLTQAECPYCYRMFCVMCKTVWHEGTTCSQNQKQ